MFSPVSGREQEERVSRYKCAVGIEEDRYISSYKTSSGIGVMMGEEGVNELKQSKSTLVVSHK